MEFNKASAVPFKVISPATGTDITNNVKLTTIETKGTSVPFLQPNGDDTFTVINANLDADLVTDTTFNFTVEDQGQTYDLSAETSVTIKGLKKGTEGTFKVKIITPKYGYLYGPSNTPVTLDYQASYNGVLLKDGEVTLSISATNIIKQETLADGVTHRLTYSVILTNINANSQSSISHALTFKRTVPEGTPVVNFDNTLLLNYQGYWQAPNEGKGVMVIPTGPDLRFQGGDNDTIRVYPLVMYNGVKFPLTASNLKRLEVVDITNQGQQGKAFLTPSVFIVPNPTNPNDPPVPTPGAVSDEYVEFKIKRVSGQTEGRFTWRFQWNADAVTTYVAGVCTITSVNESLINMSFLTQLKPNETAKSIVQSSPLSLDWTPDFTRNQAKFIGGAVKIVDVGTGLDSVPPTDLAGLAPDSINRYTTNVATSYQKQELRMDGMLGCPRGVNGEIYGVRPVRIRQAVQAIDAAPTVSTTVPNVIDQTLNKVTPVIFSIKQMRNGVLTDIPGTISNVVVTGAATNGGVTQQAPGVWIMQCLGKGTGGQVGITATVTENDVPYNFSDVLTAQINTTGIVETPKTINAKIWDVGTELAFSVTKDGVDAMDLIRNVKMFDNSSVINSVESPGKWEVIYSSTTGTNQPTFYTYEIQIDGVWTTRTAQGTFELAPWDGITAAITKQDNLIGGSTAQDTEFVVYPTYRGVPAADKFTISSLGTLGNYANVVSITPSEDNKALVVRIRATTSQAANRNLQPIAINGIKFQVKGTTGTVENKDVVTRNNELGFFTGDFMAAYNVGWCFQTTQWAVDGMRASKGGPYSVVYVYKNGVRVDLDDPNLEFYSIAGPSASGNDSGTIAWMYIGGTGTTIWGRVTQAARPSNGGYFNPIRARYKTDPGKYSWTPPAPPATDANFWVYSNGGNAETVTIDTMSPEVTAISENEVEFTLKAGSTKLTNPSIYNARLSSNPSVGNALAETDTWVLTKSQTDPTKHNLKFTTGHTGDYVGINGQVLQGGQSTRLYLGANIPVPKSLPFDKDPVHNYSSGVGDDTTVVFNLYQKRIDNPDFKILAGTLSGNMTFTGPGSVSGFKAGVTDGEFQFKVTGTGQEGSATVAFTLTVEGINYPVVIQLLAKVKQDDAVLTLSETAFTGLYNEQFKPTVTLTKDGSPLSLAGARVRVSPAGVISPMAINDTGFTFTLMKNQVEEANDKVTVVIIDSNGVQGTQVIDVTTLSAAYQATTEVNETTSIGPNSLYFKLTDAKGNVVTGAKLKSMTQNVTDTNSVWSISLTNNFIEDPNVPGRYRIDAVINWKKATLVVTSTVTVGNIDHVVNGLTWTIPDAPVTTEVSPTSIIKDVPDFSTIVYRFKQDRWSGSLVNEYLSGTYTDITATGAGELGETPPPVGSVFSLKLKGNGTTGTITIDGNFTGTAPAYAFGEVSFDVQAIDNPVVLTIDPDKVSAFAGDTISLNYTLTNNGEPMDAAGTSITFTPSNGLGSYSIDTVGKKIGFRISRLPQADTEVINTVLTFGVSGPNVKAPLEITVYGNSVKYVPVGSSVLTPSAINTVNFKLTGTDGKPATGVTFGTVVCTSENDSILVSLPAEVTESSTPGTYSFNLRATNVAGEGEVTLIATNEGINTLLTGPDLTFTNPGLDQELEISDGFQTTGAGDSENPVTLNQNVELVNK